MRTLWLRKPSAEILRQFVEEQAGLPFTYAAVGATANTPPAGFVVDRTRIELGSGESVFLAAKAALRRWQQFQLGWVAAWSPTTPIEDGRVVAIMGWAVGCWWLNACRIIYTIDGQVDRKVAALREDAVTKAEADATNTDPTTSYGFAYGTLPGHVESGEERFLVEWNRETDRVAYDILAFSKPNHPLTRLGYPFVRRSQKRFGRESAASMFRAVNARAPLPVVMQSTERT
jgi:uncharacterized protein (UPF0548 family)